MKDQSLEQQRAGDAYSRIMTLKDELKDKPETAQRYASYAKALPATILQIGLGQAMATLLAAAAKGNKNDPHHKLYRHVEGWLCRDDEDAPYEGQNCLIKAIVNRNQRMYVHAQIEALAYIDWIKKFATAYLSSGNPQVDSPEE